MFTNKTSRNTQTSDSREIYIKPYEEDEQEDNQDAGETKETRHSIRTVGYMEELDEWLDETVFEPIKRAFESGDEEDVDLAFIRGRNNIKRKVLASYHNGLKAKSSTNQKNNARQNYRRN